MKLKRIKEIMINAKSVKISGELKGFFFEFDDYTSLLEAIYAEQDEENE